MSFKTKLFHNHSQEDLTPMSSNGSRKGTNTTSLSHNHRIGLVNHHRHHSHDEKQKPAPVPIELSIELESPPVILYGEPSESSGSIISGLLFMTTKHDMAETEVENVTLSLVQTIQLNKPFLITSSVVSGCHDCSIRKNVLARWDVVTSSTKFPPGSHAYPFSHLLPGSLPGSCKLGSHNSISYIKYDIIAEAKVPNSKDKVKLTLPLNISRLILRGPDRNSLRIFPPTEVNATALLPHVIYPKSKFPMELKLDNLVNASGDKRWRMRKLSWKIEEHSKVRAYCCEKHQSKLKNAEDARKREALVKDPKTTKNSNVHHSTIQTNTSLSVDSPPNEVREPQQPSETGLGGAPVDNIDTSEVERNAPRNAHNNFVQDFGSPETPENDNLNTPSNNPSTPSNNSVNQTTPNSQDQDLHLYITESRAISHGDLKSGWKSDFSGKGKIELVAEINCMNLSSGSIRNSNKAATDKNHPDIDEVREGLRNGANVCCDIEDPNEGIFVSHLLVVEIVIAEESITVNKKAPKKLALTPVSSQNSSANGNNNQEGSPPNVSGTPTGSARVLRMQFKLCMTERSGLGISWDDEVPPTYEDVRALSPPTYESSNGGTPQAMPILSEPGAAAIRSLGLTPGVLYGVGDTPGMSYREGDGVFALDERLQEFSL